MTVQRPEVKNWILNSRKITEFILKVDHKDNKGRYKFFTEFGFDLAEPDVLAGALLRHHHNATRFSYQHGKVGDVRLAVDGQIETPDDRGANVRSIWNLDDGETARFITVKPLPKLVVE